jgi:hypothetical protein
MSLSQSLMATRKASLDGSRGYSVSGKSNIGSYWGDARDAGARKHVWAICSKGTPMVTAYEIAVENCLVAIAAITTSISIIHRMLLFHRRAQKNNSPVVKLLAKH